MVSSPFKIVALAILLCLSIQINPIVSLTIPNNLPTQDAPYSQSEAVMQKAITCPDLQKRPKGIVLLVPGTTLDGETSFKNGPFNLLLPKEGFDVCWVSPPNFQMGDVQVAGEYVAYAIRYLAPKSATKNVKVLGHSQGGGISIPWATIFFPSARKLVTSFVGLAADFHGTLDALVAGADLVESVASGQGFAPAFIQQAATSNALKAQNYFMTSQIVPTTAIFTRTDEVVIPQFGPNPSSRLPGSTQFPLQDYCGPLELSDHLSIIANPAAYALTLNAFTSPTGQADLSKFNVLRDCYNIANSALNLNDFAAGLKYYSTIVSNLITSGYVYVRSEPPLKAYVCDHTTFKEVPCGVPGPQPSLPPGVILSNLVTSFEPNTKVNITNTHKLPL